MATGYHICLFSEGEKMECENFKNNADNEQETLDLSITSKKKNSKYKFKFTYII